jgi:hypothetical protein
VRYPYERFLRYLVSRKVDPNHVLARIGLPSVGGLWASSCRSSFRKTAPHSLVRHIDSDDLELVTRDGVLEWAETEGFRELWETQPEFGEKFFPALDIAIRIFSGSRARIRMGLFLFSKATPSEIADAAKEHFDMPVDPAAVELYRKIFWDGSTMTRASWDALLETMEKEERHYLALGLENPTLDGVKCVLGMKYAMEPGAVLHRLMVTSIEQYDNLIKQPIPSSDAIRWGEMAKAAAVALAQHIPKKQESTGIPTDFGNLFTVQISKSNHVSLADLQGLVGVPEPAKPAGET